MKVDINGRWSDNGKLIAGGPTNLEEALKPNDHSNTFIKILFDYYLKLIFPYYLN